MSRAVNILVTTNINYENGVKEIMDNQYSGILYFKENEYYLRYKDNLNQELGNTWSIIKWNNYQTPYKVTLYRQGDIKMKQIFEEGYKHISEYKGAFGNISIETITNSISLSINTYGGKIGLDYDMKLNYQISGNYKLEIKYINQ